ncbi:hypothetical protein M3P19_04655 [Muricauda sp. 2012CJ35-5]|uniref:Uncharacterized protein n=1 Tax=Flagellimonas spongiicola TaxID=2942208 RepID=A0ABT0PPT1_9FLAO|nr:hypothetical protein [Allomuricauda spongiicola]MCL6273286.1 hypothetical protein [Allomuricauda spongiicola]
MTEIENKSENPTENIKLYTSKSIWCATFLGGPLAAGYMIGENYKALDKPEEGRNALILGIVVTIALFTIIFMIPEHLMDKIPNQLIPLFYTFIIWGIVEWKQGDVLKAHKENGDTFFSGWRAAGIGFVSLIVLSIGIFGYVFFVMDDTVYDQYDAEITVFQKNEDDTLVFYDHLETVSNYALIQELENSAIPKWKANIAIIQSTNQWEDLPYELAQQNAILLKYSELRLEAFELFKKAIEEDTYGYSSQLERIHKEIDEQLAKLN